ncbi:MAG: hypothetical protein ACLFQB_01840 [Chitinispirillaceae bacterium]
MRSKLLISLLTLVMAVSVKAQDQRHELGIILGEPTGLSYKYWLSPKYALNAASAWSFYPNDYFHLHADYIYHLNNIFTVSRGELPLYFGAGAVLRIGEESLIGARAVGGINYYFEDVALSLFFELAPRFDLIPSTGAGLNGGIGLRYRFNLQ